jgi:ABC-2 type transport system ATP-binding protein
MSFPIKRFAVGGLAAALALGALAPLPGNAADVITTNGCIDSVPEPDGTAVQICYSLFQPASASAASPAPVIFHSHGWGGSRSTAASAFTAWTDAGFGVISFDQRGFGASGGQAHVENPLFEGQDVTGLVDMLAELDWVKLDAPGDPVIGAIGGSYGGGYQFVGAFTDLMERGSTRFNALAPEITWYDLQDSLAPQKIPRSLWNALLYAVGATAHTEAVHKGFAYGVATGQWAEGEVPGVDLTEFFKTTGPKWHVDNGRVLDIPVLFGQGITDNLFNLNQGINNFKNALTDEARADSIFVGYNGGHVLPAALPQGTGSTGSGDPCSTELGGGSFAALSRQFFAEELLGAAPALDDARGRYHIATAGGRCQEVDSVDPTAQFPAGTIATNTVAGAPQAVKLADGPLTVAGSPHLTATVTALGADSRAFFALSVGTSPVDAKIVQSNMLPIRELLPLVQTARTIELPAVGVDVPAGQSLFLTVSPFSDMSFGHGSRAPGAILLENVVVHVPVV